MIQQMIVSQKNIIFGYKISEKPELQMYHVRGQNLKESIIITATDNYLISLAPNQPFESKLTLANTFSGDVYVQLTKTAIGEFAGKLTHTSTGCIPVVVFLQAYIGDGTEAKPFPITTADNLYKVRNDLNASYKQYCDIDLSSYGKGHGRGWDPLGTVEQPFTGRYDGTGKTIRNLYFSSGLDDTQSIIGLFGCTEKASLKNIRLDGAYIAAFMSGILVGDTARDCNIVNCHVRNSFTGNRGKSGLINNIRGGNLDLCSSVVTARVYSCGFSGIFSTAGGTNITRCWAKVDIEFGSKDIEYQWQSDSFCGFGLLAFKCNISNCYAIGKTYGRLWQCGFIQTFDIDYEDYSGLPTVISNCYAAVILKSNSRELPPPYYSDDPEKGGFAYEVNTDACKESGCYFDNELAGTKDTAVGKGMTTAQMQSKVTYQSWDFSKTWVTKDKAYPTLRDNKEG